MKTIYEYNFPMQDEFFLILPEGYEILSVGVQSEKLSDRFQINTPIVWVLVEPLNKMVEAKFRLAGTGHPFGEYKGHNFIGTFCYEDLLWFHLFEIFV